MDKNTLHPKVKFAENFFEVNKVDNGRDFVIKLTKLQFLDFLLQYEDQRMIPKIDNQT